MIAPQSKLRVRSSEAAKDMGMAGITIRGLDDDVEIRLRTRAAGERRSIAGEERQIPSEAVACEAEPKNRAAFIRACIGPFGGVERELPLRTGRCARRRVSFPVKRQTVDLSISAWSLHKTTMFQINPRLSGFTCLRTGTGLPVGDYHEGSPESAKEGFPASLYATYRGEPCWPPARQDRGMARYGDFLPYLDFPSLGEGATPLVPVPELANGVGLEQAWVKNEGQNPTGSHKDRMSPLVVARALATGQRTVAAASSGNAGVSLAAHAAAAGLNCAIVTVQTVGSAWKRALETYGVELIVAANTRERWDILRQKSRSGSWYPATNYMVPPVGSNPYGVQGFKTVAYEIVEDLGAEAPDCIIVPTARGDLLWGILEGFRELNDLGQIGSIPRMYAVEPYPRIARVLAGSDYRLGYPGTTRMSSIAGDTVSYQAVHAVNRSGGDAVVVTDDEAAAAISHLAGQGFYCESSSAASLAALEALHRSGRLETIRTAVLILTSHGFKDTI